MDSKVEAINAVKIKSVASEIEAELILNLLHSNHIPCFKKSKETGGYMNIYMGYSIFGEDIYVDKEDYEEAMDLLTVLETDESPRGEGNTEGYDEEAYIVPFYKNPQIIARILLLLFLGTMVFTLILSNL